MHRLLGPHSSDTEQATPRFSVPPAIHLPVTCGLSPGGAACALAGYGFFGEGAGRPPAEQRLGARRAELITGTPPSNLAGPTPPIASESTTRGAAPVTTTQDKK